mgnify:CR=1 FL=1
MEIFVMSAAGIYDWPIIKQVSWLLGQVMNGIYNALSAIGIENIGVAIIVLRLSIYASSSAYDQTAEVYKDVGSNAAGDSEDPEKICK